MIFLDHSATPGGGQLSALRLLPRLTAITAHAVYVTGGPLAAQMQDDGVPCETLFPDDAGYKPWKAPVYAARLHRWLRNAPDDAPIIALSTAAAQVLSLLPGSDRRRVLRLSEDLARFASKGWKSWLYFGWVFRRFDGFIVNSRWTATTIPSSLADIPVRVAYPLSGARPQAERTTAILATTQVRIACFSRPVHWKGLDIAIHAVDMLHSQGYDVSLTVFGGSWQSDDDDQERLRALAADAAAPVAFAGHVDDVLQEMGQVDVVVLPSRLPEPYGQVTAQALSAGCLTVVSAHGGSLELVEDGVTGLTFTSEDADDLARILAAALDDRERSRAIARAGTDFVRRRTDDTLTQAFEHALRELS